MMFYPIQSQHVTVTYGSKIIESKRAASDNNNSLIKVKLYEAKGECCLNLIWMALQQYSAWPSVSTEAKQAFDVACEHAVNSKAISIHEKETILRFRSHQHWGNWVQRSKVKLNWQQWWHKKWRNLIKLWWPFSPWVYSSGRAHPFTRQKSDNDGSDDFFGYLIKWIFDIWVPCLIKCEYRWLISFLFNTLTRENSTTDIIRVIKV